MVACTGPMMQDMANSLQDLNSTATKSVCLQHCSCFSPVTCFILLKTRAFHERQKTSNHLLKPLYYLECPFPTDNNEKSLYKILTLCTPWSFAMICSAYCLV